ncbi:Tuberous sclerosis 2-like protein [Recurvomyces mirabilis]|nr:Tuberous sclerosis 2-like protein [Recurvomyces mirabilis]
MEIARSIETINGNCIEPYETTICERLINELRSYSPRNTGSVNEVPSSPPAAQHSDLATTTQTASSAIKRFAKWFAPAPLADLLDAALLAATSSQSSTVLYATLNLIDTVATYTFIHPDSLRPVANFLSQAYYNTYRRNRTQKVAFKARDVTLAILKSHLGPQLDDALCDAMGGDLQQKEGFATTAGALRLLSKRLRFDEPDLPPVDLVEVLHRIRFLAATTLADQHIMEHILHFLTRIFKDDKYIPQIQQDACWDYVLDILLACCNASVGSTTSELFERLALHLSSIEPRLQLRLAWMYVQMGRPLHQTLSYELRTSFCKPPEDEQDWSMKHRDMVKLCVNAPYLDDLRALVNRNVLMHRLQSSSEHPAVSAIARNFVSHIADPDTIPAAKALLVKALVDMFTSSAMTPDTREATQPLFDALCTASGLTTEAATFLFRIRADVKGHIFISPEDTEHRFLGIVETTPDLSKWFHVITAVLRDGAASWEVYDIFLHETKRLLANHTMFHEQLPCVRQLQEVVTDKIKHGGLVEPPLYTGLTKAYVVAELVQILAASMSYHRKLTKDEITDIVATFNSTAGQQDYIVSIECIHALTICCYEVPDIMSRYMDDVVDKMSRMVTRRYLAIHVLQFLAGLSRLPDLCSGLHETDYKKIFAVCYSYLQSTRGESTVAERKRTPTSEQSSATQRNEEALPEYVYALAYHVVTFWYMTLRRDHREALKPYITSCLTYEVDGEEAIEDQGMVTVDLMDRVDADDGSPDCQEDEVFTSLDGRLIQRHRLVGMLLVSTKTSLRTGRTLVTVRRPSGTSQRLLQQGKASVTVEDDSNYLTVLPDDILGNTYGSITIPKPSSSLGSLEILTLPEDDAVRRAIESLDRTSALDSHKAGVVYIGESQITDHRIFRNIAGSPDYREFLNDLGDLETLKGATFNTQGLDRANDTDGEHTMVWHNDVTEMVFHIVTLMPNSSDDNENTARKKRHIGNDHVNIIFNNSGRAHDYDTLYNLFPGQFTYVYIIITPSARTTFVQTRTENLTTNKTDRFYSVRVVTRPDYPNISSAADEKVVSGASLAGMVRNLALNECIMSLMWTRRDEKAEYPSSWRSRLHQLRRLGERYRKSW